MEIERGKTYINKTLKYLYPCLNFYGNTFANKILRVERLAVGIYDTLFEGLSSNLDRNIFLLCDKYKKPISYSDFISWLEDKPYYSGSYCPDPDFRTSYKSIIMLKVPDAFKDSYDHFLKSEYSKMYTKRQIQFMFDDIMSHSRYVLEKDEKAIEGFINIIEDEFNVRISKSSLYDNKSNQEFDLPLKGEEEIFGYLKSDKVFIDDILYKKLKVAIS